MNDADKNTVDILNKFDISLCAHFLMCTIGYNIFLTPESLVETSSALFEHDPRGHFTPKDFREALGACIRKNWLEVIDDESYEEELKKRLSSGIPQISDAAFVPGVVDFTEAGYLLHRGVLLQIYGTGHVQYDDSGWVIDETAREVHVYAETEELCVKRVEEFKESEADFIGYGVVHVTANDPEPIGRWKPNRFITIAHGFHAVLQYQLCDDDTAE